MSNPPQSARPYFIELYEAQTNALLNKFKFVLNAKTVKEVKQSIFQKLANKNQVQKDDQIKIKDKDEYELGSDDEAIDVIPDGKVKIFVSKKGSQPVQNQPQIFAQNQPPQPIQQVSQVTVVQNVASNVVQQQPSTVVSSSTNVLDMVGFKIPKIEQTDKHVLKLICTQIRRSPIEVPIREDIKNFSHFSAYIVSILGISKQLKAVLYDQTGCPYLNNLDLLSMAFPKIDYSRLHYVVFTKTTSVFDNAPVLPMQNKTNPEIIRITKTSVLNPIDIKFEIDLSNSLAVLRHKVYEITKVHPANQILKFGNNILSNDLETLATYGVKKDSIIQLNLKNNSNILATTPCDKFYYKDVKLTNEQSEISNETLKSNLIVLSQHIADDDKVKFCAALERYTADIPLVYAFKSLFKGTLISQSSRIALQEGLFSSVLNFIKGLKALPTIKIQEVFCLIRNFFGFIFQACTKITDLQKVKTHHSSVILDNLCYLTLKPVKIPCILKLDYGQMVVVDRQASEEQINKGLTFDHYKKPNKSDLHSTADFQEAWKRYVQNHVDNDEYQTLFWSGFNSQTEEFSLPESNCQIQTYLPKIDSYPNLEVNNPMQLKNKVHYYLLLHTKEGRFRVYVSKNKNINKPFNLFDPTTGNEEACNLDLMSGAVNTQNTEVKIDKNDLKPVITREPKEAIVVLFDISGSMGTRFFNEPDLSRMGAVKSFFEAFAYRTIAYNLQHVVSLIFFDDRIQVQCDFTEAIFDFNRLISSAQARGSTKLYDSIVLAANNLISFSKKYPDCKLRILALTDGQDNSSSNSYVDAARILIQNHIIIDSFAVGSGCDGLKNITLASGGKCYLTRSLEESLKLFEQETVLSVRVRNVQENRSTLTVEQLIAKAQLKPFDEVHSVHKFKVPQIKASGASGKQLAKKLENEEEVKKISGNNSMKRIVKELQNYTTNPHPFVSVYPSQDLQYWKILLLGPKDTPYENGLFLLYVRFPNDYPFRAPEVRFITPIYHCNMNSQGRICHSVFDRNYSPALSIKNIIQCVYGLILTPEPEDPLDNVVASFYLSDYQIYLKNAKQATAKNASPSTQKLVEELYGNISDDIERQKKIKQINDWIEQAKKNN